MASETGVNDNQFAYDSVGNCLKVGSVSQHVNDSNELLNDGSSDYQYDLGGNLIYQSKPAVKYGYDALNRLVSIQDGTEETQLTYDAFNRLIKLQNLDETKHFFYHQMREIGSVVNNNVQELRIMHPDEESELNFAIELGSIHYFTIQDFRYNVCALKKKNGFLTQWYRYSAFGLSSSYGEELETVINPWRFANRREIKGLSLFSHRFYHSGIRRWLTTDPLGFEDGLHQYAYVHNNPFRYRDPDGRFAVAVPLFSVAITAAGTLTAPVWLPGVTIAVASSLIGYSCYQLLMHADSKFNENIVDEDDEQEKDRPPYCGQKLGDDATKCPGEGFKWRGQGSPESGLGSWVKGSKEKGT